MLRELVYRFSPRRGYELYKTLYENYGYKLLLMLISSHGGSKGCVYTFLTFIQLPYYREGGHSGQTQQEMFAISFIPWTVKGFIGVLSDLYPLFGYEKKYYCILLTLLGAPCCLILGFLPWSLVYKYPLLSAMLFFMVFLETAAIDLLVEGKYAEQMRKKPHTRGDLVSFVWFCALLGELVPALLVGPLSDSSALNNLFFIFFIFAIQPIIPFLMNYLIEDKVEDISRLNKLDLIKLRKEFNLILLTTLQSLASLCTIFFTFTNSSFIQSLYILISGLSMCTLAFFMIPRTIACFNIYEFIVYAMYANLQGALEYFYTANEECVPGGPKFTYTYLKTYGHIVGVFAQIIGLIIFQVVMTKWKFRHIFWSTTLLRIAASASDLILVNRYNLVIGIPDFVFFMLGYSIVYNVAFMLDNMPPQILMAKLCPKNVESTMFALLAGFLNFGYNAGNYLGIFLMDLFGIVTHTDDPINNPCNFKNTSIIILIGHGILPALTIPLAFILIPDAYLNEQLLPDDFHKSIKHTHADTPPDSTPPTTTITTTTNNNNNNNSNTPPINTYTTTITTTPTHHSTLCHTPSQTPLVLLHSHHHSNILTQQQDTPSKNTHLTATQTLLNNHNTPLQSPLTTLTTTTTPHILQTMPEAGQISAAAVGGTGGGHNTSSGGGGGGHTNIGATIHTHTGGLHVHTGGAHTHSATHNIHTGAHTHTGGIHTHSGAHTHTNALTHTHTGGLHTHIPGENHNYYDPHTHTGGTNSNFCAACTYTGPNNYCDTHTCTGAGAIHNNYYDTPTHTGGGGGVHPNYCDTHIHTGGSLHNNYLSHTYT